MCFGTRRIEKPLLHALAHRVAKQQGGMDETAHFAALPQAGYDARWAGCIARWLLLLWQAECRRAEDRNRIVPRY